MFLSESFGLIERCFFLICNLRRFHMSLPDPVVKHKSSLYLVFSPHCLPYAELATWYHSKNTAHLAVGLDSNLLATQPSLIIPKGPLAPQRTVLTGKASIARYFARHLPSLYQEAPQRFKIDALLDAIRKNEKVSETVQEWTKQPSSALGDFLAWDVATRQSGFEAYVKTMDDQPLLKKTKTEIDALVKSAPILDVYKYAIAQQLFELTRVDPQIIFKGLIEPRDKAKADITIAVPTLKLQGNPAQLGQELAKKFKTNELITGVSATGVFLNFNFDNKTLRHKALKQVIKAGDKYGHNASGFGNLAVVEFSSPNIAKTFHAGHLRSTIIGNFLSNVLKANGWSTLSMNYLGDWGKQYGLLAIGFHKYGVEEEFQRDPIKHLFDVYVKINADANEDETIHDQARLHFKKMEDGDAEALAIWQRFRDLSIVKYKDIYNRLNIEFDIYSGESQYSLALMQGVLDELHSKGLLKPDNGALLVDLKSFDLGTAVIGKTDGSLLYLSRDIAAAQDRQRQYEFDAMFYVVAIQQDHHFKQLFKILELAGKPWADKCHHISYGLVEGMSTRKGTVVFLEQILDATKEEMHNVMKKNEVKYSHIQDPEYVSDVVGMSSIFIQDMSARRIKNYTFDWSRMLSFEGDTGPYLQYAHARLCSIERVAEHLKVDQSTIDQVNFDLLHDPRAAAVLDWLAVYPDIIKEVGLNREPITLVKFCLRLSHSVSSAVTELYVQNQPDDIALARLALYKAARIVLGNGLRLLGLRPLERM